MNGNNVWVAEIGDKFLHAEDYQYTEKEVTLCGNAVKEIVDYDYHLPHKPHCPICTEKLAKIIDREIMQEKYIGNEYNIYNPAVLRRFKTDVVRIRIEAVMYGETFECSVVYPREHDGAFLMCSVDAVIGQKPD